MAKINYDFTELRSKKFDIALKIKKLEDLIDTIKNDGAISIGFLQELSELGLVEEREMIETKTKQDIIKLLQPRLDKFYEQEDILQIELQKFKKNITIY